MKIGLLTNFSSLLLNGNRLSGYNPHEISNLQNMKEVDPSVNFFSREIPSSIKNQTKIFYLNIFL